MLLTLCASRIPVFQFNLMDKSKLSKFDNFKTKAKKSLANSFENLINRVSLQVLFCFNKIQGSHRDV